MWTIVSSSIIHLVEVRLEAETAEQHLQLLDGEDPVPVPVKQLQWTSGI